METQKPHRRKIAVALLAGLMLALPVFSMTAEAQQTQQARRQGAPRGQGRGTPEPAEVTPQRPRHSNDVADNLDGRYQYNRARLDLNPPERGRQVQQNQPRPLGEVRTVTTPQLRQQLQQLDRK